MPISLDTVVQDLYSLLRPDDYRDYCPNGLQIEGRPLINKLVTGVTASQAFIEAAIMEKGRCHSSSPWLFLAGRKS